MTMPVRKQTCAICGEFLDFKTMEFAAEYGDFFSEEFEAYCDACLEREL